MQRAALYAARDIRVEDSVEPTPGPGESLVRVTSVGLCGSDLHWFGEGAIGDAVLSRPLVLGHEMAGFVLEGPLAGRAVAIDPAAPCGGCPQCRNGVEHLCMRMAFCGHGSTDGGLRELMVWPTDRLHLLPDELDPATGSLLEPLGVAVHACDLAHLRTGSRVAVVGCGPIGLLVVQLAALFGAEVVAVEPLAHRRDAARRAGATTVVSPQEAAGAGGPVGGCDVSFEVSGTDDGLARAAALVRPGGRVVAIGIPEGDSTTFEASLMRRKGLTLAFVRRMTANAYTRAISLGVRGVVDLSWLVTQRFPLVDASTAFADAAARHGLKTVIDVTAVD